MLVLKRRDGQSIEIKPGVEVIVLKSRKGEVKLGVIAPQDQRIERKNGNAMPKKSLDAAKSAP